jgi:hypothetical protein
MGVLVLGKNEGEHGCGWGKVSGIKTRPNHEGNEPAKPDVAVPHARSSELISTHHKRDMR